MMFPPRPRSGKGRVGKDANYITPAARESLFTGVEEGDNPLPPPSLVYIHVKLLSPVLTPRFPLPLERYLGVVCKHGGGMNFTDTTVRHVYILLRVPRVPYGRRRR